MKGKVEKILWILDICAFYISLASAIVIIHDIKKNKKITKLDAINLFMNGWVIGSHAK
jgi:hypothetical protein